MRIAVDYYAPNTMVGDGLPLRGTTYIDAATPLEAWDRFVVRACAEAAGNPHDLPFRAHRADERQRLSHTDALRQELDR